MQTSPPHRKKCLEVSGGRLTYQASYEMPGLAMQVFSRTCHDCSQGGGEVHYVSSCASGRITRMMLADISGSEATFKNLSCQLRNGLIHNINSIWQNRVVADVGKQFRQFATLGGFGTAAVATYFAPSRSFVMCNIGNPPPLVYRARERSWQVLHGETEDAHESNEPVEGVYGEDEYRHIKTQLEVDDIVVLYGNGFARYSFPDGGVVGHRRIVESLQDAPHAQPESRLAHLIGLVQRQQAPDEDVTIIVCRVTNTRVRLRDNLLAPFRLFRRPTDHTAMS